LFKRTTHFTRTLDSKPFEVRWVAQTPVEIAIGEKRFFSVRDFYRYVHGKPLSWSLARYVNLSALEDMKLPPVWEMLARKAEGIDLHGRAQEVVKLLYAGFGSLIRRTNLDPEEVRQEVFAALLIRNKGKCPWDAKKSSFGHYCHLVIGCVINNLLKRRTTDKRKGETVDISGMRKLSNSDSAESELTLRKDLKRSIDASTPIGVLAVEIFDQVAEGRGPKEIGDALNIDARKIAKAVAHIRAAATAWQEGRAVSIA
jgi:hypothetical protein